MAVRALAVIVFSVLVKIFLLPFRLAAGITGLILTVGGALGAIAWTIQLLIGGSGDGPLSPDLMLLTCIAAVPVGFTLLALAAAGVIADPPAQEAQSDSLADTPPAPAPAPKRWEQLAPNVIDTGTGLTVREIPTDVPNQYLDLEGVYRTAPAPYHRLQPRRLRPQAMRRPL